MLISRCCSYVFDLCRQSTYSNELFPGYRNRFTENPDLGRRFFFLVLYCMTVENPQRFFWRFSKSCNSRERSRCVLAENNKHTLFQIDFRFKAEKPRFFLIWALESCFVTTTLLTRWKESSTGRNCSKHYHKFWWCMELSSSEWMSTYEKERIIKISLQITTIVWAFDVNFMYNWHTMTTLCSPG